MANEEQDREDEHVPAKLIEERRHVPVPDVADGNLHRKGEELQILLADAQAVGLHVDVVAPAANRLAQHQRRRHDIQKRQHRHLMPARRDARRNQAADDAAEDGQPTLADIENGQQILTVHVEAEDHIIDSRADDGKRNGVEQKIDDRILRNVQAPRLTRAKCQSDQDRRYNQDGIPADAKERNSVNHGPAEHSFLR